jgi:hypothetical protein
MLAYIQQKLTARVAHRKPFNHVVINEVYFPRHGKPHESDGRMRQYQPSRCRMISLADVKVECVVNVDGLWHVVMFSLSWESLVEVLIIL